MRTSSPQSDDLTLVGNKQSAARRIDGLSDRRAKWHCAVARPLRCTVVSSVMTCYSDIYTHRPPSHVVFSWLCGHFPYYHIHTYRPIQLSKVCISTRDITRCATRRTLQVAVLIRITIARYNAWAAQAGSYSNVILTLTALYPRESHPHWPTSSHTYVLFLCAV